MIYQTNIIIIFLTFFFFMSDKKKVKITVIITVRVNIIIELNNVNVLKHANCNINSIIKNIVKFKENNSIIYISPYLI